MSFSDVFLSCERSCHCVPEQKALGRTPYCSRAQSTRTSDWYQRVTAITRDSCRASKQYPTTVTTADVKRLQRRTPSSCNCERFAACDSHLTDITEHDGPCEAQPPRPSREVLSPSFSPCRASPDSRTIPSILRSTSVHHRYPFILSSEPQI